MSTSSPKSQAHSTVLSAMQAFKNMSGSQIRHGRDWNPCTAAHWTERKRGKRVSVSEGWKALSTNEGHKNNCTILKTS